MRLGTDTGSLVNYLMAGSKQPEPAVDMPATLCMWSDRHAATVVRVWTEGRHATRFLAVQEDNAKVVRGSTHDGSAEYEYTRNPKAPEAVFRFDPKKLRWEHVRRGDTGRWKKCGSYALSLGRREEYRDPSF